MGGLGPPTCLNIGVARLHELISSNDVLVCCAAVARFYGEPLAWALALALPLLLRWERLMPAVRAYDPMASAVWLRKPPGGE